MNSIKELTLQELEARLGEWNQPPYHARQVFSWIYKRGAEHFETMTDLPLGLRRRLKQNFTLMELAPVKLQKSIDGTEKFLFQCKDDNFIEAVAIPAQGRITGCISSQAGCKFSCSFCASSLLGFKRNLSCAEMLEEALLLYKNSRAGKLTHIVFMGIGEPLDNYDNVLKAIRVINAPWGLHIGARRITISTCGFIPGIERLSEEGLQVELSVSLHASDDKTRSLIMPINRVYPLKDLMACCRRYIQRTGRQITFEYVLIGGLNSDLQNARNLVKILKNLRNCKVNLLPANAVEECNIEPPGKLELLLFRDCLLKAGVPVTLRKPRGQDIDAACGQLRLRYAKE